jgi:hypothetical protein
MPQEKSSKNSKKGVSLAVPGGLAGQLFAVGYAAWIASKRHEPVHIEFFHPGSTAPKIGVQSVLNSEVGRKLGLTFSIETENWPPRRSDSILSKLGELGVRLQQNSMFELVQSLALGAYTASEEKLKGGKFAWRAAVSTSISPKQLIQALPGSTISGFPTDYRIIEESWALLAALVQSSGSPDFAHDTGQEDSVAIHWRLGDYVGNPFHGAVSWSSLSTCLKYANKEGLPVKVFTDSPELAKSVIRQSSSESDIKIVSGEIWSDLYEMTRSRVFIGSHSGVSFLAASALRSDNPNSETWLPDKWFLNRKADLLFHQGPKTAEGSVFYPARLVTSLVPQ